MELKDGANDLPISSQGVKRPRQAGLVSDAAAEKQMCANGASIRQCNFTSQVYNMSITSAELFCLRWSVSSDVF